MIVLMKIKKAALTFLAAEYNTWLLLKSQLIILCLFAQGKTYHNFAVSGVTLHSCLYFTA